MTGEVETGWLEAGRLADSFSHLFAVLDPAGRILEVSDDGARENGLDPRRIVGTPFGALGWWGSPELVAEADRHVAEAASGREVRFPVDLPEWAGSRTVELALVPYRDERGEVTLILAEAWDVTDYVREARRLAADASGTRPGVAPLGTEAAPAPGTPPERAIELARRYRRLVDATGEGVLVLDADGRILEANERVGELLGTDAAALVGRQLRGSTDEEGWVEVAATLARARTRDGGERELALRRADGDEVWVNLTVPPLGGAGSDPHEPILALLADVGDRRARERETVRAAELRARLLDRLVRAHEQERARIAREVHDDSVQVMTAAGILVELLRDSVADPAVAEGLDELSRTVRASIARLRLLLYELTPAEVERHGLAASIRRLAQERATLAGGPRTALTDLLHVPPPPASAVALFRIAQDALSNASRHAGASSVDVRLRTVDDGTELTVADDGRGFDVDRAARRPESLGLATMRERAELAGGSLELRSAPGAGTTVRAWLPNEGLVDPDALGGRGPGGRQRTRRAVAGSRRPGSRVSIASSRTGGQVGREPGRATRGRR